jgi:hypothetical protein
MDPLLLTRLRDGKRFVHQDSVQNGEGGGGGGRENDTFRREMAGEVREGWLSS